MHFRLSNSGLFRGLLALSVSLAVVTSSYTFALASLGTSISPVAPVQDGDALLSADAVLTEAGVRIEWSSKFDSENLGFNVYRVRGGKRTRINREIIPGSVFSASPNDPQSALLHGGQSYAWFDPAGTEDSVYYVESVSQRGVSRLNNALTPVAENVTSGKKQLPRINDGQVSDPASTDTGSFETSYPAVSTAGSSRSASSHMSASAIEDQWAIAAQTGLKIAIKKDGWYRVTQPQMAAAGFNPSVDIRNLQLFVDGQEVAISTSQSGGLFGAGDYLEFYGRGIDVPTSDTRTYYLIAAASPGKRVQGELQIDTPSEPTPTPSPAPAPTGPVAKPSWSNWVTRRLAISPGPIGMPILPVIIWPGEAQPDKSSESSRVTSPEDSVSEPPKTEASETSATPIESERAPEKTVVPEKPTTPVTAGVPPLVNLKNVVAGAGPLQVVREKKTSRRSRKGKKNKLKRHRATMKREYSHAMGVAAVAPTYFNSTVERKDRGVYFSSLLNGDEENFFGQVVNNPSVPSTQTINTPNPDLSAPGTARLEVKLQGVNFVQHQVNLTVNDVSLGTLSFFGHERPVHVLNVPLSLLQDGTNTLKFAPAGSLDTSIVDYVRITYPHKFRADADSLKFSLLGTQTLSVDGFTNQNVRLIDYTDSFNVRLTKPEIEASGGGYAITVPPSTPRSKTARLLYANATTPLQPAAMSLNLPSTWNLSTNAYNFVIITSSNLMPSLAPLVAARQAQGHTVALVNVEDVYDEFGYGLHGPQAVKDFLERASTAWAITKPQYVIFAGDASLDPRNYTGLGNFDLVPTKLLDATFNETASDEWLADFDNDGVGEVAIGRLPVRTPAEADLVISKIVNFTPATVPQGALLVADAQGSYFFSFEAANDEVGEIVDSSLTVHKVVRQLAAPGCTPTPPFSTCQNELDEATKAAIINNMNQGQAVINYSGHGNVDVWTGGAVFRSPNATALTNGLNKLFVVVVMDCLNGYYQDPQLLSLSEAFLKAPNGGAVAAFASSGLTLPDGQHAMSMELYSRLYGPQPIALGDAIKIAKAATFDIDVRHTWIFFGDPSMKIR